MLVSSSAFRTKCYPLVHMANSDSFNYTGMERWKGRVAIVTGASAGIGYELSKRLVQLGVVVVGCARNIAAIESLSQELSASGGKLVAMKCDVRKEEDILSMMSAIKSQFGGADICVNNAGLGYDAPLLSGTTEKWKMMLDVNVLGLCIMTREFIKQLRERNVDDGHVVHLNSTAGHTDTVWGAFSMYNITKQAVTALTEGLRQELRGIKSNIKITAISPGEVKTEFQPRFQETANPNSKEVIDKTYAEFDFPPLQPEDIVSTIIYALATPPHMQIHDLIVRSTQEP
ncbi:dehydrogenase/reductase SDR family member 11-like isoform X1 [Dysidea avara]|uniref:dehydrogenase/reductase SDR family member 11-like isoform X1 n=1 Tax=Dysidea avara TaxID=196820 RepID=UPI00332F5CB1